MAASRRPRTGAPRPDGADRPGRRRLPGGNAVRQPARGRRRRWRRSSGSMRAPTSGWRRTTERSPTDCATPPSAGGARSRSRAFRGLLTVFFTPSAGSRLRGGRGVRPGGLRGLVPGAARARRLPARVAVRGWFPSLAHTDEDIERTVAAAAGVRGGRVDDRTLREALRQQGGLLAEPLSDRGIKVPPGPAGRRPPPAPAPPGARPSTSCCSR